MQKLETEIDVPLFDRNNKKIQLNDNGKLVARYARQIVSLENEMKDAALRLEQNTNEEINTIAENSSFASFNTDVGIRYNILRPNRIEIPILDDAAATYYYCICLKDSYIGNALIHKLQFQYQK